mgnify:FL=1|jgi:hypothetical protein
MKKSVLSIVLTVVMLFSLTATVWGSAWPVVDSGYCGYWDDNYSDRKNMTWQLMKDGTLEFFGEGYMEDFSYYSVPWKDYVDQIKEVVIYGPQDELKSCIFSIGRYAFSGCKNLKKISIPVSVEIIGLAAFSGSGIESIHLPANLKTISSAAFSGCTNLKSVEFPAGLTKIENMAFEKSGLIRMELPDTVTTMGSGVFSECPNLEFVKLPRNLEVIEMSMFKKCAKLQSVVFPENVKVIGRWAFMWCDELQNFTLPESVETIGLQAFIDCESLTEVTIPANVTTIEQNSFSGCGKLRAIYVAEGNPAYQSVDGVLMTKDGTMVHTCPGAKEGTFVIPNGVTTIASLAFFDCQNLKRLVIPATLTTINERGFDFCYNLLSFYFSGAAPEEELLKKMDISRDATLYYLEGQSGWTSPTYLGYKTALWDGSSKLPGTLPAGDANGDGRVGVEDVQQLYGYLTGQNTITIAEKMAADVNNDGEVDVYDLQLLYERLAQGTTL